MWSFEEPGLLVFILFLPALMWLSHSWKGRGGRIEVSFGVWNSDPHPGISKRVTGLIAVSSAFWWIGLAVMVVALAGPTWIRREPIYLTQGIDIMVVLDESPSMAAQDYPPRTRFETAVATIEKFVKGRENDAIGLVTFAKDAALRVPPTLDYDFLLSRLKEQKIMSLGNGSSLGLGLAYGVLHLQNAGGRERVIIVLTDGENNSGEIHPQTAAEMVRSLGIRLYVVGIGTEGRVPIELELPEEGQKITGTLEGGFNESLLRNLITTDRGAYFNASSASNLEAVFRAIDTRESSPRRIRTQVTQIPLYREFLLGALALLTGALLIRKLWLKELL